MSDACLEWGHAGPASWCGLRFEGSWACPAAQGGILAWPRAGNASAVLRQPSIARMEETVQTAAVSLGNEPPAWSKSSVLSRRQLAAGRVLIPAAPDEEDGRLRDLSGDITLKPGELGTEFYGVEDPAAKFWNSPRLCQMLMGRPLRGPSSHEKGFPVIVWHGSRREAVQAPC